MKRKLFISGILGLGWLCMAYSTDHGIAINPASGGKKLNRVVLSQQFEFPGKVVTDSADPQEEDLTHAFELGYNSANGIRLNPRAIQFVQDYMVKNGDDLRKMKGWAKPYFTVIDGILQKYGLPSELKYLCVIESELKSTATSWAGAVGPWQLMPETARLLGLRVERGIDERKNYTKSTHAAAKYLRDLYREFGDWLLVIAAYNGGPANVYSAIKKSQGSRNFWKLQNYLPAETRMHVKKFIGTHYIFEGQGSVTTLTKAEVTEQLGVTATHLISRRLTTSELTNAKSMEVSGKYYSSAIAKNIMMDMSEFNRYNPEFDAIMASNDNAYELKLPADKMDLFIANKYIILNESVQMMLTGATVGK
ncbi:MULTISPECIES: lytic transglycosylase domain-containing protein [Niastella]|uniref:Lytic transglycosylase domain-containing protein n=1 Tax=Niastella soli TaxID=2821487 RepID=A0ABS3YMD9_9BACT|nr:lytic transglycosylase domain-containing protein [Niastella soli]MBO9199050.1 lytic transglycosylase domain-containing protein [Niastella soli]